MSAERSGSPLPPAATADLLRIIHTRGWFEESCDLPAEPHPASLDEAEGVLDTLLASRNRKGSVQQMALDSCREGMLAAIRRCVKAGKPVELSLMAFPFKVPNPAKVGQRRLPDLAELAALQRIRTLSKEIEEVYPPGLLLHLIHDGSYIGEIFGVGQDEVVEYETYFGQLVQVAGLTSTIRRHDFFRLLHRYGEGVEAAVDRIGSEAVEWLTEGRGTEEWRSCFNRTLGMIDLRAHSPTVAASIGRWADEGRLPPSYRHLQRRTLKAMLRYRIRDVLLHRCDPRDAAFPDAIHVTTKNRPGRLAIWLVRRGRSLLPWHGVGVADADGRPSVSLFQELRTRRDLRPFYLTGETEPFGYVTMPAESRRTDVEFDRGRAVA